MAIHLPDIYEYLDYRAWLRDIYRTAKAGGEGFSYRAFSKLAGFSSPNFLQLVITGERNLGPKSVKRLIHGLRLDAEGASFFRRLVELDQASTPEARTEAYESLATSRKYRQAHRLSHAMFLYLSRWYYPAIRELAGRADFVDDPEWIARQLVPEITPAQAAEALERLFDLELLRRTDDGRCVRGETSVSTGHEVASLAIGNYHRQMTALAMESIERVHSDLRELSALTLCITEKTRDDLIQRLRVFRENTLTRCDADDDPEIVYQLNIQLFPLSTSSADSGEGDHGDDDD